MHRNIYWSRTRRPSSNARGRLIWMRGVGTQGYSGRQVSNTTAVPPAFPFPPRLPSLVLPPAALRRLDIYVCPSFLTLLLVERERKRGRESSGETRRENELPPFHTFPSLSVLYLSSLASIEA